MILELSTMTKMQGDTFREMYFSAIENGTLLPPFEQFDECGLKYSVEHLASIGKFVIFFPVELMVNYVDEWTKDFVDSNITAWTAMYIMDIEKGIINLENINTTSIGNLAYCYVNSKNCHLRKISKKLLDLIFSKMQEIILQESEEFRIKHWG